MKKYFTTKLLKANIITVFIFSAIGIGNTVDIDVKYLPLTVKAFISDNLKSEEITNCWRENSGYKIATESGTEIEFSQKGEWNNIKNNKNGISRILVNLLPYPASLYLKTNYNNVAVDKIKRDNNYYRVELKTIPQKSILLFTKNGKMKKVLKDY
ncbi:MAG: PepSY-like domain-containing protein [Bacteroidales bacterium]